MKTRIISLVLSFAFLSMLSIEYISITTLTENTTTKTIESVLEKRLAEKFVDDEKLFFANFIMCQMDFKLISPTYAKIYYSFTSNNTLFKPPINS